jgi:hypothetical protein
MSHACLGQFERNSGSDSCSFGTAWDSAVGCWLYPLHMHVDGKFRNMVSIFCKGMKGLKPTYLLCIVNSCYHDN